MRKLFLATSVIAGTAMLAGSWIQTRPSQAEVPARTAPTLSALGQLQFVANRGQWHEDVRFAALGDTVGWLHDDGFTLRLERWTQAPDDTSPERVRECAGGVVRTRFLDGAASRFDRGERLVTKHNFLRGDGDAWQGQADAFATVTAREVLPGIDVHYRALPEDGSERRGAFEYDLLLQPGADLDAFAAECEGVERLRIDEHGQLVATVPTPIGAFELVQAAPIAWQETASGRRPLEVQFRLLGSTRYGFVAVDRDPTLVTVVDPGVVWGTFLGGGATERIHDMEWVPGEGVWVAGWVGSTDFPTTPGAFSTTGASDGFVARLSDDGQSLLFATYIGGSQMDSIRGLSITADDTPVVVGFTNSADFPTTPSSLQPAYAGGDAFLNIGDAFVARLNASGDALIGATYLGGIFDDIAEDVVTDDLGNAYVVGWTSSFDFPTTAGVVQPALGGVPVAQSDGFVASIDPTMSTVNWSTYYGGLLSEQLLAVDRDPSNGNLLLGGWTSSFNYPVSINALGPASNGQIDAVATCLNSTGTATVFSTYVGGLLQDVAMDAEFAADGTVWICGSTESGNYPTTLNAPQSTLGGAVDGFLTQVSANGTTLLFSTMLGGPGQDRARDLSLSSSAILVGGEAAVGFPVTPDAVQTQFGTGVFDAFATLYSADGATMTWSSYFGGLGQDAFGTVQLQDSGLAVLAGWTYSTDFPVAPAGYQSQLNGLEDGVVIQLDTISSLGAGVQIAPISLPTVENVEDGEVELLRFQATNLTTREVELEDFELFLTGSSIAQANVSNLRVLFEGTVVGTLQQPAVGTEIAVDIDDVELPAGATIELAVVAEVSSSTTGATAEVAAAVIGANAWEVDANGAGEGPDVRVMEPGRVEGPVYVLGALPGDIDGDGERTVFDVRRLVSSIGTPNIVIDADGDGVIGPTDVAACKDAIIGRGTMFEAPTLATRLSWLTFRCLLPRTGSLQASLGGRTLEMGRATPRQLTLRVPDEQPSGVQELIITLSGRVLYQGFVEVL